MQEALRAKGRLVDKQLHHTTKLHTFYATKKQNSMI